MEMDNNLQPQQGQGELGHLGKVGTKRLEDWGVATKGSWCFQKQEGTQTPEGLRRAVSSPTRGHR